LSKGFRQTVCLPGGADRCHHAGQGFNHPDPSPASLNFLGEHVSETVARAEAVTEPISKSWVHREGKGWRANSSVKPSQMGLDIDFSTSAWDHFRKVPWEKAREPRQFVARGYGKLRLYGTAHWNSAAARAGESFQEVGERSIQSALYRSEKGNILREPECRAPTRRQALQGGAYLEPEEVAYPQKAW